MAENVEDYLEKGMYGAKEINPAEKKKYLGTFRERVVLVMNKKEVQAQKGLTTLEEKMHEHKTAKLLLNGALEYTKLRPYIQLAEKNKIPFSIVGRKEDETEIYLALACPKEVDISDIYLPEEDKQIPQQELANQNSATPLLDKIRQLFK